MSVTNHKKITSLMCLVRFSNSSFHATFTPQATQDTHRHSGTCGDSTQSCVETTAIGNDSVPIVITNDTMSLFFKLHVSSLAISNRHNSFRVLFDKIASVYFTWKYIYILASEMASPWNQHCASCIGTLSFRAAAVLRYFTSRYRLCSSLWKQAQTAGDGEQQERLATRRKLV